MYIKRILTCIAVLCMINFCTQAQTSSLTVRDLPKITTEQQYKELLSQLNRPLVITYDMSSCYPSLIYKRRVLLFMYENYPELADYYTLDIKLASTKNITDRFGIERVPVTQVVYNKNGDGLFTKVGFSILDESKARNELKYLIIRADELIRKNQ
ncbi:MAG: thioredoxin family protein [Bacteroidaceae bacterium]|nr:thioredoxin family protein [Bacteroidaceae bacterium]